jgi:MEMO1 family protein
MIVFLGFTPHSPLLLESIGKENTKKLKGTLKAMETLSEDLYASKPDIVVTISSHSGAHENAFSINLHDEYTVDLKEFGDLSSKETFSPDPELVTEIRKTMKGQDVKFTLDSYSSLDYGVSVPLELLIKKDNKPKLVPISYSHLSPKDHLLFGRLLKDVFVNSKKRIAIVASGDLSHCLTSDAPAGFEKEGKEFDDIVLQSVKDVSTAKLISIDEEIVSKASECAYRPLLILFGIIEKVQVKPEVLSYESPFGVGHLVAEFHIL